VVKSTITNTRWNAVSLAPSIPRSGFFAKIDLDSLIIGNISAAGIYFQHALVAITNTNISDAKGGGIVGVSSSSFITNNFMNNNTWAGIRLKGGFSKITGNVIFFSLPTVSNQYGDGIVLSAIPGTQSINATLTGNGIDNSARAGVSIYGSQDSSMTLQGNAITCSSFDLDYEQDPFPGSDPGVFDAGGNGCGCPNGNGNCKKDSSHLTPPDPIAGP
jgi:Right handed beta helix region